MTIVSCLFSLLFFHASFMTESMKTCECVTVLFETLLKANCFYSLLMKPCSLPWRTIFFVSVAWIPKMLGDCRLCQKRTFWFEHCYGFFCLFDFWLYVSSLIGFWFSIFNLPNHMIEPTMYRTHFLFNAMVLACTLWKVAIRFVVSHHFQDWSWALQTLFTWISINTHLIVMIFLLIRHSLLFFLGLGVWLYSVLTNPQLFESLLI